MTNHLGTNAGNCHHQYLPMLLWWRVSVVSAVLIALLLPATTRAQSPAPWQQAEMLRQALFAAQTGLLANDTVVARRHLDTAQAALHQFSMQVQPYAPEQAAELRRVATTLALESATQFAATRATVWTMIVASGMHVTLQAIERNEPDAAQQWLQVRAFRKSTRFSAASATATTSLAAWRSGTITAQQAAEQVRIDLLDTYQALTRDALTAVAEAASRKLSLSAAESAAFAAGYFTLQRSAYQQARGVEQLDQINQHFAKLARAAVASDWTTVETERTAVLAALQGWSPISLSDQDVARKAGQILQFLQLIQIEYEKGVRNGQIVAPIEVQETKTFHQQVRALLEEISPALTLRDPQAVRDLATQVDQVGTLIDQTAAPSALATATVASTSLLKERLGVVEQGGDITAIIVLLQQVQASVARGDYAMAETLRLQAYAIFEVGAEQKLLTREPALGDTLQSLFWQGTREQPGLAVLIREQAPTTKLNATTTQMVDGLNQAQTILAAQMSPVGTIVSSIAILLREGLEAVLVIGVLLGYLRATKAPAVAQRSVLGGVGTALLLSGIVWAAAQTLITITSANRELIEGVMALLAAAVLFYVTNWLLHKVYVTDWVTFMRQQVQRAMGRKSMLGLASLGFMVVFREGFETVLFFQVLLFDAPTWAVAVGIAIGTALISVLAVLMLQYSVRVPLKPFFATTSMLLLVLAVSFIGNGLRNLQEAGWLKVTRLQFVPTGFAPSLLGLFPTVETIIGQGALLLLIGGTFAFAKISARRQARMLTK